MLSMSSSVRPDWREGARSHYKASSTSYRSHSASSSSRRVINPDGSSSGWVPIEQTSSSSARNESSHSPGFTPNFNPGFNSVSKFDARSASQGSLHKNMLQDLESSLKASSNYMESHRSTAGPGRSGERHEYYSSSFPRNNEFNLEKQVQHMLPQQTDAHVKSQQSQKMSSNMMSSSMRSSSQQTRHVSDSERPGSRLKQNIDELDNLLYDLNETKPKTDYTQDYDHSRRAQQSSSYEYNTTSLKKPPSPMPRREPSKSPMQNRKMENNTSYSYSSSSSYYKQENNNPPIITTTSYHSVEGPPNQEVPKEPIRPVVAQPASPDPNKNYSYYSKYESSSTRHFEEPPPQEIRPATPIKLTQKTPQRVEEIIHEISETDRKEITREPLPYVERKEPETGTVKSTEFVPLRNERLVEREIPKEKKKREKIVDKDGKKGAAVVPICLPLCCAAPCVIM